MSIPITGNVFLLSTGELVHVYAHSHEHVRTGSQRACLFSCPLQSPYIILQVRHTRLIPA